MLWLNGGLVVQVFIISIGKVYFTPKDLHKTNGSISTANTLKTLELNVTFYRFPQLSFLETWYKKSPNPFSFSVKMPRATTHYKQFIEIKQLTDDFYGTVKEGLKDKLGCVLFQMPPRMAYKQEKLEQIIDNLNPEFNNVLEFRHESWWNAEVYNKLSKHNITFCGMSHPQLPEDVIQNTKVLYFRFHGVPHLYSSPYDMAALARIANEIEENAKTKEAFIYFNNDIGGSAIKNAKEMEEYVLSFTLKSK